MRPKSAPVTGLGAVIHAFGMLENWDAVQDQPDDRGHNRRATRRVRCGTADRGRFETAREACNVHYPMRVGNYLPQAHCVDAAIERYALPSARYPDLIRLQAQVRVALSEKIDRRRTTVQVCERRMAEAAAAERDRDAGNQRAADRRIAAIEQMLK